MLTFSRHSLVRLLLLLTCALNSPLLSASSHDNGPTASSFELWRVFAFDIDSLVPAIGWPQISEFETHARTRGAEIVYVLPGEAKNREHALSIIETFNPEWREDNLPELMLNVYKPPSVYAKQRFYFRYQTYLNAHPFHFKPDPQADAAQVALWPPTPEHGRGYTLGPSFPHALVAYLQAFNSAKTRHVVVLTAAANAHDRKKMWALVALATEEVSLKLIVGGESSKKRKRDETHAD